MNMIGAAGARPTSLDIVGKMPESQKVYFPATDIPAILSLRRGGGGGAKHRDHLHGDTTTMTFLAAFICLALAAAFCWLLFAFAVFALPFFAGLAVASWVHTSGASWPVSVIAGAAAAALTYIAAMTLGAPGRPVWLRGLVGIVFAIPAVFLGFQAAQAIARSFALSDASQLAIGAIGAMVTGAMAFFKIMDPDAAEKKSRASEPTEA